MVSNMKIERIRRGINQFDLGMQIGIPQWRVSLIERGLPPKKDEARRIAEALDNDVKLLFSEPFVQNHEE